ncbi:MAG: 5'-nucleotidase C-terminal domain-containing protein [Thermotogaceae bacterium]|nr:5'-nucleotidase C-terminal domain-containing protein [Thermotogaceae bacterium]
MKKLVVLVLSVLLVIFAFSVQLTILHINDTHGHAWAFNEWHNPEIGGFAAISTLADEIRYNVEAKGGHVLFLHAGDMNTGVPESDLLDAIPDITALNMMGLDAMTLGNHEFDNPRDVLELQMKLAKFPMLSANLVYKDTGKLFAKPYIIKDFGDIKVAIIGVITEATKFLEPLYIEDLDFLDAAEAVQKYVDELRDKVDVIIVLAHLGWGEPSGNYNTSFSLARKVHGVDVIIDGHSHSLGKKIINGITIVQAGEYSKWLGRLDLDVEKGKVTVLNWQAYPINLKVYKGKDENGNAIYEYQWQKIDPDPLVAAALAGFKALGGKQLDTVIGKSSVLLEKEGVRNRSTALGNLVADAIRWKANADIAFTNGGGIRASILPGDITIRNILTVHPFGNTIYVMKLTGDQIKKIFEYTATLQPGMGAWPQISGATVKVKDGKVVEIKINGKPLDPNKVYVFATNNYLAGGGDGYSMLKEWAPKGYDTGFTLAQAIIEYIQKVLGGTIESYDDSPRYQAEQ